MNAPLPTSFRDPSGYVFMSEGEIRRVVTPIGKDDYELLIRSGLYEELASSGRLVQHDEQPGREAHIYKILAPRIIPVISYPYEWCFSQLKDAALLTLEIQSRALDRGMSLKDATTFNVQFVGSRPVFIDTLSFEKAAERPWVAYKQFCEMFLAPLTLMADVIPDFNRYLAADLHGVELSLCSRLLPRRTWFQSSRLIHIHLHSMAQRAYSDKTPSGRGPSFGKNQLKALIESLASATRGLELKRKKSTWGDYYGSQSHYSAEAGTFKTDKIQEWLEKRKPSKILDLGGNNGKYSRLATARKIYTVCADVDPFCVEDNYAHSRKIGDAFMLPLLINLSNPSPDLGWAGSERLSFLGRMKPDLTFALALVHHLRITLNVPLCMIADFFGSIAGDLIIEFVPKNDPMTAKLLSGRADTFQDYEASVFEREFGRNFRLFEKAPVPGTGRVLYFWSRIHNKPPPEMIIMPVRPSQ